MSRLTLDANTVGNPNYVTALARGLKILRCFGSGSEKLSNSELSRLVNVPRGTVARMTFTLSQMGYLKYTAASERYSLSASVLELGFLDMARDGVTSVVAPFMQELADETDCMVALGQIRNNRAVYVHVCQGQSPLRLQLAEGAEASLTQSAMGRAYLAALPTAQREQVLAHLESQEPENWNEMIQGVEQGLEDYARYGFCISAEDWRPGVSGVAVPLRVEGQQIMPINCGASSLRLNREILISDIGPRLRDLVAKIEAIMLVAH